MKTKRDSDFSLYKMESNYVKQLKSVESKDSTLILEALLEANRALAAVGSPSTALTRVQFIALDKARKALSNVLDESSLF